jgi:hypothetical protein
MSRFVHCVPVSAFGIDDFICLSKLVLYFIYFNCDNYVT